MDLRSFSTATTNRRLVDSRTKAASRCNSQHQEPEENPQTQGPTGDEGDEED